jgi:uncharacterized protein (DUF2235 family)
MLLYEFFDSAIPGRENPAEDNSTIKLDDRRKTRLTLAQINRLRMMNDVRKVEHEQQLKRVSKQYRVQAEGGVDGAGAPASL